MKRGEKGETQLVTPVPLVGAGERRGAPGRGTVFSSEKKKDRALQKTALGGASPSKNPKNRTKKKQTNKKNKTKNTKKNKKPKPKKKNQKNKKKNHSKKDKHKKKRKSSYPPFLRGRLWKSLKAVPRLKRERRGGIRGKTANQSGGSVRKRKERSEKEKNR